MLKLFEQHNAEFAKKVGHSRAKGTFQRYITVCKHILSQVVFTAKTEYDNMQVNIKDIKIFNVKMGGVYTLDVYKRQIQDTAQGWHSGSHAYSVGCYTTFVHLGFLRPST